MSKRINIQALVDLLGERNTVRLSVLYGNFLIPSKDSVRSYLRDQAIAREYLSGTGVADLSLKYRVNMPYVRKVISTELRRRREAELRQEKADEENS